MFLRLHLSLWLFVNRLNFLLGLQELTSRYEKEVQAAQKVFTEVHTTLESEALGGTVVCIPSSYHQLEQRLQLLKVSCVAIMIK